MNIFQATGSILDRKTWLGHVLRKTT